MIKAGTFGPGLAGVDPKAIGFAFWPIYLPVLVPFMSSTSLFLFVDMVFIDILL